MEHLLAAEMSVDSDEIVRVKPDFPEVWMSPAHRSPNCLGERSGHDHYLLCRTLKECLIIPVTFRAYFFL
jgi:hypothetical protein